MAVSLTRQPKPIEIVWTAEVIVHRGPVDDPLFLTCDSSATVTAPKGFTDLDLTESCVEAIQASLAETDGVAPEDVHVIDVKFCAV